jgi:hypothetical protein
MSPSRTSPCPSSRIDAKELQIEDVMAHVGQTYLWAYLPEANGFRPIGPRKDNTP